MRNAMELLKQAIEFHRTGDLAKAESIYRSVLALDPEHANALCLLGLLASQVGQVDTAIEYLRRAVSLAPHVTAPHRHLGRLLTQSGRIEEAKVCYEQALQRHPRSIDLHFHLGELFRITGCHESAQDAYRRVLALDSDCAEAHNNLGLSLQRSGKLEEATEAFQRAIQIRSDFAEALNNLANALQEQGRLDEARQYYRRAIQIQPDRAQTYNNKASILRELGLFTEAIQFYQRALAIFPDYAQAYCNLGQTFQDTGQHAAAIEAFRRAFELRPDWGSAASALVHELQHVCDWHDLDKLSQRVMQLADQSDEREFHQLVSPFSFLGLIIPTTAEQQCRCASKWAASVKALAPGHPQATDAPRIGRTPSRLKIGYLSSDFYDHPTTWLITEMLEQHDRDRFEIFGYSCGPNDDSPARRRVVNAFDHFRDVLRLPHAATAGLIAADGIDILVDLKGYTQGSRTPILAARPAPIQVNFLGFPGTMGADFMDYILVDDFVVPADQQPFYSSRLFHLPGCYQPNVGQHAIADRIPNRIECGLPAEGFVFCSFNNTYKLTPTLFDIWMRLLESNPTSVLWLLEANPLATHNLRTEAVSRGVDANRLVFAPRLPLAEHLARHRLADLFLDSFPVNAHTTASDALRMGLPLLTLAGQTFVSRVAGSLLRTLELPELITYSFADYESQATQLSHDPCRLDNLRQRLCQNVKQSSLYDGRAFARKIEVAFQSMWDEYDRRDDTPSASHRLPSSG